MAVTAKTIKSLPDGVHRLERGVYLRVRGNSRQWIFKYQINGKRREMGLGDASQTLDMVRSKVAKMRLMLSQGIDPLGEKQAKREEFKRQEKDDQRRSILFEDFYEKAIEEVADVRLWSKRDRVVSVATSAIKNHFLPGLGKIPVSEISPVDVVSVLIPIWDRRCGQVYLVYLKHVFKRAVTLGLREDNPCEWKRLEGLLPSPVSQRKGKILGHQSSVSLDELRSIVRKLIASGDMFALCTLFGFFTVGRRDEYRLSTWDEVNIQNKTLTVPPERRKDKRPENFTVPLTKQALFVLERIPRLSSYVFTINNRKPVDGVNLLQRLKRLTSYPITLHGTRSTFSDWCANNDKNFLVSEKCLMHNVGGAVFMAYQRDDLLDKRRVLLQEWADAICPMEWLDALPVFNS